MRAPGSLALVLLTACGPTAFLGGEDEGEGEGPRAPGDIEPRPDDCGAQTELIPARNTGDPPDLLVVLDRSATMGLSLDPYDPEGPDRLAAMGGALAEVAGSYRSNIRFGLSVFPTDDGCEVAPGATVPIAGDSAGELADSVSSLYAAGNTPGHLALENAAAIYAEMPVNPAGRYVLFATDGAPNCGPDGDARPLAIDAIEALSRQGIGTFVLGFGDVFGLPTAFLDEAAIAGGMPRESGPHRFYHAGDAGGLAGALAEISGGAFVPSCSYVLDNPPPDPDLVTVTIDGQLVLRDPSRGEGWDYEADGATITFFGGSCDLIESGGAGEVSFVYGCPEPPVD